VIRIGDAHGVTVAMDRALAPPWRAAVAGATSALAALAASELVTALHSTGPSLVSAVGTQFVDRFAASLKELAVSLFGTGDKAALLAGIVVVSALLGAALGVVARRWFWLAPIGFAGFALLGLLAYLEAPLRSVPVGIAAAVAATVVGTAGLGVLLGRWRAVDRGAQDPDDGVAEGDLVVAAPGPPPTLDPRAGSRRSFLVRAGVLGAGAAGAAMLARSLGRSSAAESVRRRTSLPAPRRRAALPAEQPFGVAGLSPYITPNEDFYRIDTALVVPDVDASRWGLEVVGLVDRPVRLTYDELLAMPSVEAAVTLQCVSNEVGGDLVGNAIWQGVPLATLLERARVRSGADQVVGRSVDGWTAGFPISAAGDGRVALVAYAMNGSPLPVVHGFPARLVVAGLYGYVSATKWLRQIELTTWDGFDGYWVPRGWAKEGPIKTTSRIDVPARGAILRPGPVPVAGVAWAPPRGIARVEVQVDDGPWQACQLGRVASADTWVQWRYPWDAEAGPHILRVRAVDGDGVTQTAEVRPPDPDGATGLHARRVRVEG
jgi:DMSO/TMAO reductase YedYZ molybdopterin-dependent catalytic subunit